MCTGRHGTRGGGPGLIPKSAACAGRMCRSAPGGQRSQRLGLCRNAFEAWWSPIPMTPWTGTRTQTRETARPLQGPRWEPPENVSHAHTEPRPGRCSRPPADAGALRCPRAAGGHWQSQAKVGDSPAPCPLRELLSSEAGTPTLRRRVIRGPCSTCLGRRQARGGSDTRAPGLWGKPLSWQEQDPTSEASAESCCSG